MATGMRPRFYPPVYFLLSVIAMVGLHYAVPVARWLDWPWRAIGIVLILGAVALGGVTGSEFRRRGTTITPFEESSALLTEGAYRFTRNPLYLSMAITLTGFALLLGTVSPLVVIPVFVWWMTTRFIVLEEEHLTEQFGAAYLEYRSRVRRWL